MCAACRRHVLLDAGARGLRCVYMNTCSEVGMVRRPGRLLLEGSRRSLVRVRLKPGTAAPAPMRTRRGIVCTTDSTPPGLLNVVAKLSSEECPAPHQNASSNVINVYTNYTPWVAQGRKAKQSFSPNPTARTMRGTVDRGTFSPVVFFWGTSVHPATRTARADDDRGLEWQDEPVGDRSSVRRVVSGV